MISKRQHFLVLLYRPRNRKFPRSTLLTNSCQPLTWYVYPERCSTFVKEQFTLSWGFIPINISISTYEYLSCSSLYLHPLSLGDLIQAHGFRCHLYAQHLSRELQTSRSKHLLDISMCMSGLKLKKLTMELLVPSLTTSPNGSSSTQLLRPKT